ncbi:LysR family transcriptional regulator [Leptolyngbya sp. O-77]|uniref:LysR family transcriptional regulator n=1 Tax=Leptolyngbya sp. O-77 TaxID=1080068 RepID=UPI00074D4630|nr:LysR family transcriptional regulator [Leptolyngbya sp. O-77]BAU44333.1 Hca operon transcriptional activator [Leptolyngbya sp. O-77]
MIELRHLRYFITVAEELHFGRPPPRLHMAQPPLSQQIRQLEEKLGFQLFHRTKRSVQLTEAGAVFLAECQRIMQQLDQAVQLGQQVSRGERGQLVIGFVSSAAYSVLPTLLRRFRTAAPEVSLELHELTTDQQIQWLRDRRMDVGLVRPPIDEPDFCLMPLFEESLVVALPQQHPLAQQPQVSLKDLAGKPFILFPRLLAPGLYDQIISLCQQGGFSPAIVQEAIQMQTIISLVAAEIGVAIVPLSLQNLQRTGVVYRELQEPTPKAAIALLTRQSDPSPTVQRFLAIAQTQR